MLCSACSEAEETVVIAGYSLCPNHAVDLTAAVAVGKSPAQWFREAVIDDRRTRGIL